MRVVVIGGKGHVGTYLIPRLVEAGHTVINVSRGEHSPYQPHPAWQQVRQVTIDRAAAEADGNFGELIRALDGDVVIDMPINHSRVLDLLNRPGAFLNVRDGDRHHLVCKARVTRVNELADAPGSRP